MIKNLFLCLSLFLITSIFFSCSINPEVESRFNEATFLYNSAKYDEALQIYENLEQNGFISNALFFNAANCCYKLEQPGRSILYYKKALYLNPNDAESLSNLQLLLNRENINEQYEGPPQFIKYIFFPYYILTINQIIWLLIIIFTLSAVSICIYYMYLKRKKILLALSIFFACLFLVNGIILIVRYNNKIDTRLIGMVLTEEANLYNDIYIDLIDNDQEDNDQNAENPDTELGSLDDLIIDKVPFAAEVYVINRNDQDYYLVNLKNGQRGYLKSTEIGLINDFEFDRQILSDENM